MNVRLQGYDKLSYGTTLSLSDFGCHFVLAHSGRKTKNSKGHKADSKSASQNCKYNSPTAHSTQKC